MTDIEESTLKVGDHVRITGYDDKVDPEIQQPKFDGLTGIIEEIVETYYIVTLDYEVGGVKEFAGEEDELVLINEETDDE